MNWGTRPSQPGIQGVRVCVRVCGCAGGLRCVNNAAGHCCSSCCSGAPPSAHATYRRDCDANGRSHNRMRCGRPFHLGSRNCSASPDGSCDDETQQQVRERARWLCVLHVLSTCPRKLARWCASAAGRAAGRGQPKPAKRAERILRLRSIICQRCVAHMRGQAQHQQHDDTTTGTGKQCAPALYP